MLLLSDKYLTTKHQSFVSAVHEHFGDTVLAVFFFFSFFSYFYCTSCEQRYIMNIGVMGVDPRFGVWTR